MLLVHGIADGPPAGAGLGGTAGRGEGDRLRPPWLRRIGAPEPYERTTVEEQAEDAATLLRGLDAAPAVVCGRDLGASWLSTWSALSRAGAGRGAVDPRALPARARRHRGPVGRACPLENALRDGGPADAVEAWLAARGAPADRIARARSDHVAFFADYAGLATWSVLRRDLGALDLPVAVLVSAGAPAHVRETARALAELVPTATLRAEDELVATLRELL